MSKALFNKSCLASFAKQLELQIGMNRTKWNRIHGVEGHKQHRLQQWRAIAQEQLSQLDMALQFGTTEQVHQEIFHVAAILYEMHEKLEEGGAND